MTNSGPVLSYGNLSLNDNIDGWIVMSQYAMLNDGGVVTDPDVLDGGDDLVLRRGDLLTIDGRIVRDGRIIGARWR